LKLCTLRKEVVILLFEIGMKIFGGGVALRESDTCALAIETHPTFPLANAALGAVDAFRVLAPVCRTTCSTSWQTVIFEILKQSDNCSSKLKRSKIIVLKLILCKEIIRNRT
jgi:hypothetical protein